MSISTMDGLVAALAGAQRIPLQKASVAAAAGFNTSLWDAAGNPGAGSLAIGNTTTGIIPTDATAGSPPIIGFSGANKGYISRLYASSSDSIILKLYDRIWHAGSIPLTIGTTTFSSQPSVAARVPNTDYGQVEMWLEFATANSANASIVTATYTDQSGNAGATATIDAAVTSYPIRRMLPFRLASGDNGVQKVESLIVATATGTGTVNVVLLRPLAEVVIAVDNIPAAPMDPFALGLPEIFADSCLALMVHAIATTTGSVTGRVDIAQG